MGRSFTLIELMIGVGIVATLMALAMPKLAVLHQKAKRAEVAPIVDGITSGMLAYCGGETIKHCHFGDHVVGPHPRDPSTLGRGRHPWTAGSEYDLTGFRVEGEVYGTYLAGPYDLLWGYYGLDDTLGALVFLDLDDDDDLLIYEFSSYYPNGAVVNPD